MLHFENVSKSFLMKGRMMPIISNGTFTAHFEENFGLVVPKRGGKTTMQNLILGAEQPDMGKVYRYGKISWPVGGVGGIIPALTGSENCRFIAMIYGLDPDEVLAFTIDLARIGRYMDMPVKTYSSTLQARLSMALLLSLEFDMFLVVEGASTGDQEFSQRAGPLLKEKLERTPIMFMGDGVGKMRSFCKRVAILNDCKIYEFDDLDEAEAFQKSETLAYG